MKKKKIVIILPCAGAGTRLGYAGHKELYPLFSDHRLIDFSLNHITAAADWLRDDLSCVLKVVAVIRPWKTEITDYIKTRLPETIPIVSTMFNNDLFEWPGSVHSAQHLYGDYNIVLLPDSLISMSERDHYHDSKGLPLIIRIMEIMAHRSVVFGALHCPERDPRLRQFGAVHMRPSKMKTPVCKPISVIDKFQDKPAENLHEYNGFWCCYGFAADAGTDLYHFLARSVAKSPIPIHRASFALPGAFTINGYSDFGTMGAVQEYRRHHSSSNS